MIRTLRNIERVVSVLAFSVSAGAVACTLRGASQPSP
jgi:hypothetical protein